FAMPRTNPYLLQNVGWKTTEVRLTTTLQCRIDGDALAARTNIRLSRLQLVRASAQDGAQARIGLPLGMITSLMKDKRGDITVSFPMGGRLSDPRFDLSEAIWSAVRTVAINAITLPVSWIGRVHFSPDSKIEQIEVDPVPFEPGAADLTAEGRTRVAKLQAFLTELPAVKMILTPVVSSRAVAELKRKNLAATMARAPDAAARLFAQRFPGRPVPETQDAIVAALLEQEPAPTSEIRELAAKRLEAVRGTLEQASIDGKRLEGMKPVQQEGAASEVTLNVVEPEGPRKSKVRETVDRVRT